MFLLLFFVAAAFVFVLDVVAVFIASVAVFIAAVAVFIAAVAVVIVLAVVQSMGHGRGLKIRKNSRDRKHDLAGIAWLHRRICRDL